MSMPPADCRMVTKDMVLAVFDALGKHKIEFKYPDIGYICKVWPAVEEGLRDALAVAPWCEHGIMEFEYCELCRAEYRRAERENYPEEEAS